MEKVQAFVDKGKREDLEGCTKDKSQQIGVKCGIKVKASKVAGMKDEILRQLRAKIEAAVPTGKLKLELQMKNAAEKEKTRIRELELEQEKEKEKTRLEVEKEKTRVRELELEWEKEKHKTQVERERDNKTNGDGSK
ncbi:uncharacterized protein [Procambarus clarkii]|uniref:uncharacterized protein n=1 Tax=Procambarus clarkii TaxID=6728 RepID=UPI0037426012